MNYCVHIGRDGVLVLDHQALKSAQLVCASVAQLSLGTFLSHGWHQWLRCEREEQLKPTEKQRMPRA